MLIIPVSGSGSAKPPQRWHEAGLPRVLDVWNLLPLALAALIGWRCFGLWGALGLSLFTMLISAAVSARRPALPATAPDANPSISLTSVMLMGLVAALVVAIGSIALQLDVAVPHSLVLFLLLIFMPIILLIFLPITFAAESSRISVMMGLGLVFGGVVLLGFAHALGVQGPAPAFGTIILRPESPFLVSLWESSKQAYELHGYGQHADLAGLFSSTLAMALAAMGLLWMLFRGSRTPAASGRGEIMQTAVRAIGALMIPMAAAITTAIIEPDRPHFDQITSEVRTQWSRDLAAACGDLRQREEAKILGGKTAEEVILRTREADRAFVSSGCGQPG